MRPDEIIDTIVDLLDGNVSDRVSFVKHELDSEGEDSDVYLPIVEIQPITMINLNDFNTDFVGYKHDEDGNQIGRIYQSRYEMDVQLDVWTAARSEDDPNEIGGEIRTTLYPYTSSVSEKEFPGDVWKFSFLEGNPNQDLTMSPSVRRWEQDIEIWSYEQFDTTEDYITGVSYPDVTVSQGD